MTSSNLQGVDVTLSFYHFRQWLFVILKKKIRLSRLPVIFLKFWLLENQQPMVGVLSNSHLCLLLGSIVYAGFASILHVFLKHSVLEILEAFFQCSLA